MSKCKAGIFGSHHANCYPTKDYKAEVVVVRNDDGEVKEVKLGKIKKRLGAVKGEL